MRPPRQRINIARAVALDDHQRRAGSRVGLSLRAKKQQRRRVRPLHNRQALVPSTAVVVLGRAGKLEARRGELLAQDPPASPR
jgi:hypothetical protein